MNARRGQKWLVSLLLLTGCGVRDAKPHVPQYEYRMDGRKVGTLVAPDPDDPAYVAVQIWCLKTDRSCVEEATGIWTSWRERPAVCAWGKEAYLAAVKKAAHRKPCPVFAGANDAYLYSDAIRKHPDGDSITSSSSKCSLLHQKPGWDCFTPPQPGILERKP